MELGKQLFSLFCGSILICLILIYGIAIPLGKERQATKLIKKILKELYQWLKKTHLHFWHKDWKITLVIKFFVIILIISSFY